VPIKKNSGEIHLHVDFRNLKKDLGKENTPFLHGKAPPKCI
jgi:hypothetical protein